MRLACVSDSLDGAGEAELRARIAGLERVRNRIEAQIADAVARLDQLAPDSCPERLREELRITPAAAWARVRDARTLKGLTATREAFAEGAISAQHVRVICRAAEQMRRCQWQPARAGVMEHDLAQEAVRLDPSELHSLWVRERYRLDHRRRGWRRSGSSGSGAGPG